MAKLTLAVLRKRAPNASTATLKRDLRTIRYWENVGREIHAKVRRSKRDSEKWRREICEAENRKHDSLQSDYANGDQFALLEAYLDYGDSSDWISAGIRERFKKELDEHVKLVESGKKKKPRPCDLRHIRWFTVNWILQHYDCKRGTAFEIAAKALNCKSTSPIRHAFEGYRKQYNLRGEKFTPHVRGSENVEPADMLFGPDEGELYRLLLREQPRK